MIDNRQLEASEIVKSKNKKEEEEENEEDLILVPVKLDSDLISCPKLDNLRKDFLD